MNINLTLNQPQIYKYNSKYVPVFRAVQSVKNKAAKRVSEPNLSTYINAMQTKLHVDENIKFFVNALSKIDTDSKRAHKSLDIADIGCCDGSLCRTLKPFLPDNVQFYGLDLSEKMLEEGRIKDEKFNMKGTIYQTGNAFNLPYRENSKDAIILSSAMHELYSYPCEEFGEQAYSKDSILHFLQKAYKCLKPGGVLIIKDPATVNNDPDEKIKICNINKSDGKVLPINDNEELKNADITTLSTYDKLKRFCMDFYPAKGLTKWDKDGNCIMPRWLVTEWVRHRKWLKTPENWAYEIKEQYGTISPKEMAQFAKRTGFDIVKVENLHISDKVNFYKINENEFELRDAKNKLLSLEDFPMFIEVVLKKTRDNKKY